LTAIPFRSSSQARFVDSDQPPASRSGHSSLRDSETNKPVTNVLVCLAGGVVPWHCFNLVAIGPIISRRAIPCHSKYQGSRCQAENAQPLSPLHHRCCIDLSGQVLTFARKSISVFHRRCEMKNPTRVAELYSKLGAPLGETVESLRLLKAFLKLAPARRFEVIKLVENLAIDPAAASELPLS
jgi:hypothetical protein